MRVGELFVQMALDSRQYERDLSRVEKKTTTLGDILSNALSVTLGMAAFEAIKQGFQIVAGEAISFNSTMEQARIGFTTMLGSAEKAQAFLEEMADFAAKTPFEYPELLSASKRMMAMGFAANEVLPTLKAVGDATAGLGAGNEGVERITYALGQMRTAGRLSAQDMRQLTDVGVPAWEMLAESIGKSVSETRKLAEQNLLPADKALQTIIEGMEKRFPNMMEKMQNSWIGVTSTIKDVWRMTIGALTSNLFKGITTWLQGVRDWATDFYETFQKFGLQAALTKSFGAEFAAIVNLVTNGLNIIIKYFVWWYGVLKQNWTMVKFIVTALVAYTAVTKTAAIATSTLSAIILAFNGRLAAQIPLLSLISTAVGIYRVQMALAARQGIVLTGVIARLRVALYSLWTAIGPPGWAVLAIIAALTAGIALWSKYVQSVNKAWQASFAEKMKAQQDKLKESTKAAANASEEQADALETAAKAAKNNLQSFDEVHQLQEDLAGSGDDLLDLGGEPETKLEIPELDIGDMFEDFEMSVPTLGGFWDFLKQGAKDAWESVKKAFSEDWQIIKGMGSDIWKGIVDIWRKDWDVIKEFFATAWSGVKESWNIFLGWAGNIWGGIKAAWSWFTGWVLNWAGPLWDGVKVGWNVFFGWAGGIWEGIKGAWSWFTGWVLSWALPLWGSVQRAWSTFIGWAEGLWGGVKTAWNAFISWIVQTWTTIGIWLSEIWTWIGGVADTSWNLIKDYITDPIQSAWTWLEQGWNAIGIWLSEKWGEIELAAQTVWDLIRGYIVDPIQIAWDWLVGTWDTITIQLSEKWEGIKSAAETAWEWVGKYITDPIQAAWTWLETTWGEIKGFLEETWEGIKKTAGDMWKGIVNTIIGFIHKIIDAINGMIDEVNKIQFDAPDWIPIFGGMSWGFDLPTLDKNKIPALATGTNYVPEDMLAFLHEGEAVVPKEFNSAAFGGDSSLIAAIEEAVERGSYAGTMQGARIASVSNQGSGQQQEIVLRIDGSTFARLILPALIREGQRQGINLIPRPQGI